MYITKVRLQNIRCFTDLTVGFGPDRTPALIAGDNGDGKTTFLQSIAIGLCDQSSASALFRELPGEMVRRRQESATITVELISLQSNQEYKVETTIESLEAFERLEQLRWTRKNGARWVDIEEEDFPWKKLFICGYGAGRATQGDMDVEAYAPVDAVETLFRYQQTLQNAELAMRRLIDHARKKAGKNARKKQRAAEVTQARLVKLLKGVLNLKEEDDVRLTSSGIDVKGPWGKSDLRSCGDGYKAMTTCILDFIAWSMVARRSIDPTNIQGILLFDEVEQHLHPRWQINVLDLLTKALPKVQIIATTHSPLVVSGCKDCGIHSLLRRKHGAKSAFGWLAEDIYREILGLDTSRPAEIDKDIADYQRLHAEKLSRPLTPQERARIKDIEGKFAKLPATDPVAMLAKLRALRGDSS